MWNLQDNQLVLFPLLITTIVYESSTLGSLTRIQHHVNFWLKEVFLT
jgi:hypothetical protein